MHEELVLLNKSLERVRKVATAFLHYVQYMEHRESISPPAGAGGWGSIVSRSAGRIAYLVS